MRARPEEANALAPGRLENEKGSNREGITSSPSSSPGHAPHGKFIINKVYNTFSISYYSLVISKSDIYYKIS
jgi:hypothetical protein